MKLVMCLIMGYKWNKYGLFLILFHLRVKIKIIQSFFQLQIITVFHIFDIKMTYLITNIFTKEIINM